MRKVIIYFILIVLIIGVCSSVIWIEIVGSKKKEPDPVKIEQKIESKGLKPEQKNKALIAESGQEIEPNIVIVKLKNRGEIKGIVIQGSEEVVALDLGYGTVEIPRYQISRIEHPEGGKKERILREWKEQKALIKKARRERKFEHSIWFRDSSKIIVEATLNGKVKTKLLVDTGATSVFISLKIAKQLFSVDVDTSRKVEVRGGGGITQGIPVVLESVEVSSAKAKNVGAVVMLNKDLSIVSEADGLLGMSFLNRFHVRIDSENNKLILKEKYR